VCTRTGCVENVEIPHLGVHAHGLRRKGQTDEQGHVKYGSEDVARVALRPVLAKGLAVIAGEDHHRPLGELLPIEALPNALDDLVHPANGGQVGAFLTGAEGLELRRRRVLVHVHEVQVQEEGAARDVRIDQPVRLLEDPLPMGPDR